MSRLNFDDLSDELKQRIAANNPEAAEWLAYDPKEEARMAKRHEKLVRDLEASILKSEMVLAAAKENDIRIQKMLYKPPKTFWEKIKPWIF